MNFDNLQPKLAAVISVAAKNLNVQFARPMDTEIKSEMEDLKKQPFCSFFYLFPSKNKITITINDCWDPLEVAETLALELTNKHNLKVQRKVYHRRDDFYSDHESFQEVQITN